LHDEPDELGGLALRAEPGDVLPALAVGELLVDADLAQQAADPGADEPGDDVAL
jgi:hypothetical protein